MPAENARLFFAAPAGTTIRDIQPLPPASTVNDAVEWNLGVLNAGQELRVFVTLSLDERGDKNLAFKGVANGLEKTLNLPISVVAPSLAVSVTRKPENTTGQAEVNEIVYYEVGVKNTGPGTLTNLTVHMETSTGLARSELAAQRCGP